MTNYSYRLFPLLLLFMIILNYGCSDDVSEKAKYRKNSFCIPPSEIGIDDYVTTASQMDGIKYKWTKVEGAFAYEFQLYTNDNTLPDVSTLVMEDNSYTVVSLFEIGDMIKGQVRTISEDGGTSEWVSIQSLNMNGGATVDNLPSIVDWDYVCNVSPCKYIQFIEHKVEDCEGNVTNLGISKNFYRKSDVCPCLFEEDLCTGLQNITECLHTPCLKRNYTVCNP